MMRSAQPGSILEDGELPRTHAPTSLEDYVTQRPRNRQQRGTAARQSMDNRPAEIFSPRQPAAVTPTVAIPQIKSRVGRPDQAMLAVPADPWSADGEFRQWQRGDGSVHVYKWQLGEWKWRDLGIIDAQNMRALHRFEEESVNEACYRREDGTFNQPLYQTHLEMAVYEMCKGHPSVAESARSVPSTPLVTTQQGSHVENGNAIAPTLAASPDDVPPLRLPSASRSSISSHYQTPVMQQQGLGGRPTMQQPDPFASQAPPGLDPRAATWPRQPSWKEQQAHRSELARLQQEQARRELEAHRASLAARLTNGSPTPLPRTPMSPQPNRESTPGQLVPDTSHRDELRRTVLHDPMSSSATCSSAISSVFSAPPSIPPATAARRDMARGYPSSHHSSAPGETRPPPSGSSFTGPLPVSRPFPTAGDGRECYGHVCSRDAQKRPETDSWWMSGLREIPAMKDHATRVMSSSTHEFSDPKTVWTTFHAMQIAFDRFQGYLEHPQQGAVSPPPERKDYFDTFKLTGSTLRDHLRSMEPQDSASERIMHNGEV